MPPLTMHMTLARELAQELADPALEADPGAYYLGATTPDIRVLTRWDRARTHFFDLDDFGEQSGAAKVFREHPDLAAQDGLGKSTVAFVCGYLSHLEMDETWISDIYRPCFGVNSPLKGDVLANLLDRVLQFELDRRQREDRDAVAEIQKELLASAVEVAIGFIDGETLRRWCDVSVGTLDHQPDWDRFGMIASRHLRAYGVESESDLAHFLKNIPDLLDQAIRQVTVARIEAFEARSRERARSVIRAYLS